MAEKRGRLGRRPTTPILLLITVILCGCSPFGGVVPASGWPEASMTTQTASINDEASRFTLVLPPGWVQLRAGDEGWVTVYGKHDSPVEQQVGDGTIQYYALPLPVQADDGTLNLAVYVRPTPSGMTLAEHADVYKTTLESAQDIREIQRDELDVGAGHAVRLSGLRSDNAGQGPVAVRLTAYILLSGNRVYFLDFVSKESTSPRYSRVFLSVMESLRFL